MIENSVHSILPADYAWLCILVVSMLPFLEARAAIPLGLSSIWGGELPLCQVCLFAFIGSSISAVIVLCTVKLFAKLSQNNKRLSTMHKKLMSWFNQKVLQDKGHMIFATGRHAKAKKWWFLFVFTAIPIPLSGVWTAAILGVIIGAPLVVSLSAIILGSLVSVVLVSLFCTILSGYVDILLVALIIICTLTVIYYLMSWLIGCIPKKSKNKGKI